MTAKAFIILVDQDKKSCHSVKSRLTAQNRTKPMPPLTCSIKCEVRKKNTQNKQEN